MTDEMEKLARMRQREHAGEIEAANIALNIVEKIRKDGVTEDVYAALVDAESKVKNRQPYMAALMFLLAKDFKADMQRQKSLQMN